MSVKCRSKLALFFLLFVASGLVYAQAFQNIAELQVAANRWLDQQLSQEEGRYEVSFSNLDPRLRLVACESPLMVEVHGNDDLRGRVNLKVTCLDQDWFVYLGANIARFVTVVVAKNDLPRKAKLHASMLNLTEMDVSRVRGDYFTGFNEVEGYQLRNRLRAGDVLSSKNLLATDAVNRGEQITIVATNGVLSVRMGGEALDSGKLGDQIRVRNLQSGRVIRALVVGRGKVEVRY